MYQPLTAYPSNNVSPAAVEHDGKRALRIWINLFSGRLLFPNVVGPASLVMTTCPVRTVTTECFQGVVGFTFLACRTHFHLGSTWTELPRLSPDRNRGFVSVSRVFEHEYFGYEGTVFASP